MIVLKPAVVVLGVVGAVAVVRFVVVPVIATIHEVGHRAYRCWVKGDKDAWKTAEELQSGE